MKPFTVTMMMSVNKIGKFLHVSDEKLTLSVSNIKLYGLNRL